MACLLSHLPCQRLSHVKGDCGTRVSHLHPGAKEAGKGILESKCARWNLQCQELLGWRGYAVSSTESLMHVVGLELDLEGKEDFIRQVKVEVFLPVKGK